MIQPKRSDYLLFTAAYIEQLQRLLLDNGIDYDFLASKSLLSIAEAAESVGDPEARLLATLAFQTASTLFAIHAGLIDYRGLSGGGARQEDDHG